MSEKYGPGDDLDIIKDSSEWPAPMLPMKKSIGSGWRLGFFSDLGSRVVFFVGPIHKAAEAERTDLTPEEVLAKGWEVD